MGWELRDLIEAHLSVPAGPLYGQPLTLTDEQVRFLVRLYRIDPRTGRRAYRRAVLRRSKGWGKSPFTAAWAFCELVGPVMFDGWDANGEPMGRPRNSPWVQIAATAEDQTENTWQPLIAMLEESPAVEEYGIDVGLTRIFLTGRPGRIEQVTSKAGTREGQPITAAVLDQTETWLKMNGGVALAATILRNAAKNNVQTVETPNAHVPGDGSVAEQSMKAAQVGTPGLLYDNREAPEVPDLTSRRALKAALRVAYGDSRWVDLDRLVAEIQDPATTPSDARRWWLNQVTVSEESIVSILAWRELALPTATLAEGDQVALGFDGSVYVNATALIAIRYPDCTAFPLAVWERPLGAQGWEVPRAQVHAAIDAAFRVYRVRRFYFDPPQWRDAGDTWVERYGDDRVARFETARMSRMAPACERLDFGVRTETLHHNGDPVFERHLANGRRAYLPGQRLRPEEPPPWIIVEKGDNYPIDAVTATVVALQAYGDALAAGEFQDKVVVPWAAYDDEET